MTRFKNASPDITLADLQAVEVEFGFQFPNSMRTFYLTSNGGQPPKKYFITELGPSIVHKILPIKFGAHRLEDSIRRTKVEKQLLPESMFPFAIDPGGNLYCFSSSGEKAGAIFLIEMDGVKNQELLADSFEEFVSQLSQVATGGI